MNPDFLAVGTDGKIWVTSDFDQALALANISHIYEISPVGHTPVLVATLSGTGSPYTVTSGPSIAHPAGVTKIRK